MSNTDALQREDVFYSLKKHSFSDQLYTAYYFCIYEYN
jgi:hypothetical protein